MTIKELKEKIKNLPDDARIELALDVKINNQSSTISRQIDSVDFLDKNNTLLVRSWWGIQFFY
jgi:hypothetical protein